MFIYEFLIFMNISQNPVYACNSEVFLEQNKNLEDGMLEYAARPESGVLLLCLHVHGVCQFSRSAR